MLRNIRWLLGQWKAVYRHNGGIGSLLRCGLGSVRIKYLPVTKIDQQPLVECVTFSVVPRLTELWAAYIGKAIDADECRIIVGDCSGGFRNGDHADNVVIEPLLNHGHGEKLDLFLQNVCQAKYVIVSDDDVFWPNTDPWHWALEILENDLSIPVVSLRPRNSPTVNLRSKVPKAMGSYCLIIRRETWLKERLSFKVVHPPHSKYEWIYDTADFANLELIQRGYTIPIAPAPVQQQLVGFEGVSQGILRIQKYKGEIGPMVEGHPLKQEKTLHAILVARGLANIASELRGNHDDVSMTQTQFLDKAQAICEKALPAHRVTTIRYQVDLLLDKLRSCE